MDHVQLAAQRAARARRLRRLRANLEESRRNVTNPSTRQRITTPARLLGATIMEALFTSRIVDVDLLLIDLDVEIHDHE